MTLNRLFFGGYYLIQIESIRVIESRSNFQLIITALYYLDTILSGGGSKDSIDLKMIKTKHIEIIQDLINGTRKNVNILNDKYIQETFSCFRDGKRSITLNITSVPHWKREIKDLIMYKIDEDWYKQRDDGDMSNLFKRELIDTFPNLKELTIKTNGRHYTFSLSSLLSIITGSSLNKIILELAEQDYYNNIKKLYGISSMLRRAYNSVNYEISDLEQNTGKGNEFIWCRITRM